MKWQQSIFRKMLTPENAAPANDATTGGVLTKKSTLYRSHQQERTSYQPLYREPSDSAFAADWSQTKPRVLYHRFY